MRDAARALAPRLQTAALACLVGAFACGKDDPAPKPESPTTSDATNDGATEGPAAADPDTATPGPDSGLVPVDPAATTLRTGTAKPIVEPEIAGKAHDLFIATANSRDGGTYVQIDLQGMAAVDGFHQPRVHVDGAIALYEQGKVVIRWPHESTAPKRVHGTVFYAVDGGSWRAPERWHSRAFAASLDGLPDSKDGSGDSSARVWAQALESRFGNRRRWEIEHPWHAFARGRMGALARSKTGKLGTPIQGGTPQGFPATDLSRLMDTTTASLSIQEALQNERGLRVRWGSEATTIPVADIPRIPLESHPFADMQRQLPPENTASPEPLAAHVPADFWYLRFSDIRLFLRALDEADAWMTPVQHILQEDPSVRGLAQRYEDQLGLGRSDLARQFGHAVVDGLAVVGSDPYLREGSDITMLFSVRNETAFDRQLAQHINALQTRVPGIETRTETHGSVTITVTSDAKGLVRQHRAKIGDIHLISNSLAAIRRVLDAGSGAAPKLSNSEDFRYMMARDPGTHDALAFLSDAFIAAAIGPEQKILQSRRQRALAALQTPPYAALTYGWWHGREPTSTQELVDSGLLDFEELTHSDGSVIEFQPGTAPRSKWGEPAMLTPLIDLPALTHVSEAERRAYEQFSAGYQQNWTQFIDPVAARLDIDERGGREVASLEVRVLPLIEGSDYNDVLDVVGTEHVAVPHLESGVRGVWAVGDTRLRKELNGSARMLSGRDEISIDWLGSWVMVGSLDRPPLLDAAKIGGLDVQLPDPAPAKDDDRSARELAEAQRVGRLPVFVAADVGNPAALVATLAGVRAAINGIAPGTVDWKEHSRHGETAIVRVGISPTAPDREARAMADAIALYYAQIDGALILAVDPEVLKFFIDRASGSSLVPRDGEKTDPQFVFETRAQPDGAMKTAMLWLLQSQANRSQDSARAAAEALLRGAPSTKDPARFTELASAYLGSVPVSASGRSDFSLAADGVHDGTHGSRVTPTYPPLPTADSPIAALMRRLEGVRAEVSFDAEPGANNEARSLHTRFELTLGPK